MLIINFEGREAKGLSKGRYDETFAGEDVIFADMLINLYCIVLYCIAILKESMTADTCTIADPEVASSIQARFHTFVEIDHETISTAILLLTAYSRRVVVSYKRKNVLVKYW